MKLYTVGATDMQRNSNDVKDIIIDALAADGLFKSGVDPEKAKAKYMAVVYEKGFFGKFFDKLWGLKDGLYHRVVKDMEAEEA